MPFCNDEMGIDPPTADAVNLNFNLTGNTQHPVTKIAPVVFAPTHALEYWKDNNLIVDSRINSAGVQQDMYLSGYAESECCGFIGNGAQLSPSAITPCQPVRETYVPGRAPRQIISPVPVEDRVFIQTSNNTSETALPYRTQWSQGVQAFEPFSYPSGRIVAPVPVEEQPYIRTAAKSSTTLNRNPVIESYCGSGSGSGSGTRAGIIPDTPEEYLDIPRKNQSGWVNTSCGYNPDQLKVGLPSNLPVGNCEQAPELKTYNENLFTSIITPGMYTHTQVNEPINSNIGISFQQQFEPVTTYRDDKGLQYVQHDPRMYVPEQPAPSSGPCLTDAARYDNVYDPRFYGYGTSYRSYIHPVTGQPRFMYDDINSIRMPNYLTRNKLDHLPYGDTYGPIQDGSESGNVHNPHIRTLAQDSWMRDSIQFREDLMERRMRKVNAEAWQRKQAPFGPNRK